MKFSYTHHMPYTGIKEAGQDWPVANHQWDPELGTELFNSYIDNKVYAEEVGFDWIGCNEHHMRPYGLMPNPNLVAAAIIQRTTTAGILQSGNIVPLANPIRIAEEYAMLDVMSRGRLIAGFMRGIPHEYVAYNVSPEESYGRMYEACELIKKCWTETEPFGWEGEYYQYRAISIWPKPVQTPHPRILMSGSSKASAKLAAEMGAIVGILRLTTMEGAREAIDDFRGFARDAGWEPVDDDIMIGVPCMICDTDQEAWDIAEAGNEYFTKVLGGGIRTAQKIVLQKTRYFETEEARQQFQKISVNAARASVPERAEQSLMVCGTPERAIAQIKELKKQLGHGRMNLNIKVGNTPDSAVLHCMAMLRDVVFPAVRDV